MMDADMMDTPRRNVIVWPMRWRNLYGLRYRMGQSVEFSTQLSCGDVPHVRPPALIRSALAAFSRSYSDFVISETGKRSANGMAELKESPAPLSEAEL